MIRPLDDVVRHVAETSPLPGGKDTLFELADGRLVTREVLEQLQNMGMVRRKFCERVNVCPHCESCHVLFREVCPHCGGSALQQAELIHHYPCAGVFAAEHFGVPDDLSCPKCRKTLSHVGVDHEYLRGEHTCAACQHSASVPVTAGRCLNCNSRFLASDARQQDWYHYEPTEDWNADLLGDARVPDQQPAVLLVAPDESHLGPLQSELTERGTRLIWASTGTQALHIAETGRFDIVVLSMHLADVDGFELAGRLLSKARNRDAALIFFSPDRLSEEQLLKSLAAGANDVVAGPFEAGDLARRVDLLLIGRRRL